MNYFKYNLAKTIIIFLIVLAFFQLSFFIISALFQNGFTNWVFVDGVNWYEFILSIINGEYDFFSVRSSSGFIAYYTLIISIGGIWLVLLSNFCILYYGFTSFSSSLMLYLFFPFYFICSFLPSKDLLVIFPAYFFIKSIVKGGLVFPLMISLVVFLIRDGFGIALFLFSLLFFTKLNVKFVFLCIVFFLFFIDSAIVLIAKETNLFVFERTIGYFTSNGETFQPYLVRVFGNITNLSARATFFSLSNAFSLTGFALFLSGIGILYAFFISMYNLFLEERGEIEDFGYISSSIYIFLIILFSFSPLIQPRYLICNAFFVVYFNYYKPSGLKFNFLMLSVFATIFLRLAYSIIGIDIPLVEDYNFSFIDFFGF